MASAVVDLGLVGEKEKFISLLESLRIRGGGFFLIDSSGRPFWKSRGAKDLLTPDVDLSSALLTYGGWQRYASEKGAKVIAWKSLRSWNWVIAIIVSQEEFSSFRGEKFMNSLRNILFEILRSLSFGKRGYIQMFLPSGKLILSSKDSLDPDDVPRSPFVKKALVGASGAFFYDWKGERKLRAFLQIKVPWAPEGRILVLTAYVSDFVGFLPSSLMLRLTILGVVLFLGLFSVFGKLEIYSRKLRISAFKLISLKTQRFSKNVKLIDNFI